MSDDTKIEFDNSSGLDISVPKQEIDLVDVPPSAISFYTNSEEIFRINPDFTITLNPKWNENEAAMKFWEVVIQLRPKRAADLIEPDDKLEQYLRDKLGMRPKSSKSDSPAK